jgi:hypothetical protein
MYGMVYFFMSARSIQNPKVQRKYVETLYVYSGTDYNFPVLFSSDWLEIWNIPEVNKVPCAIFT